MQHLRKGGYGQQKQPRPDAAHKRISLFLAHQHPDAVGNHADGQKKPAKPEKSLEKAADDAADDAHFFRQQADEYNN